MIATKQVGWFVGSLLVMKANTVSMHSELCLNQCLVLKTPLTTGRIADTISFRH